MFVLSIEGLDIAVRLALLVIGRTPLVRRVIAFFCERGVDIKHWCYAADAEFRKCLLGKIEPLVCFNHEEAEEKVYLKVIAEFMPDIRVFGHLRKEQVNLVIERLWLCVTGLETPHPVFSSGQTARLLGDKITLPIACGWLATKQLGYLVWFEVVTEYSQ